MNSPFMFSLRPIVPRPAVVAVALVALAGGLAIPHSADARGGHGGGRGLHARHGGGGGMSGSGLASDRKHADDKYVKESSEELDKVLDTKIKNICRGC